MCFLCYQEGPRLFETNTTANHPPLHQFQDLKIQKAQWRIKSAAGIYSTYGGIVETCRDELNFGTLKQATWPWSWQNGGGVFRAGTHQWVLVYFESECQDGNHFFRTFRVLNFDNLSEIKSMVAIIENAPGQLVFDFFQEDNDLIRYTYVGPKKEILSRKMRLSKVIKMRTKSSIRKPLLPQGKFFGCWTPEDFPCFYVYPRRNLNATMRFSNAAVTTITKPFLSCQWQEGQKELQELHDA